VKDLSQYQTKPYNKHTNIKFIMNMQKKQIIIWEEYISFLKNSPHLHLMLISKNLFNFFEYLRNNRNVFDW
jgi:hypothetical protein